MTRPLTRHSLLGCHNLSARIGDSSLFGGLGFSLLDGGILLLRGRNGSGKTTLLRQLAGVAPLGEGEVSWRGEPARSSDSFADAMLYLGHLDALKEDVSVQGNLLFWADMSDNRLLVPAALHYFGLAPYLDVPCRELSAGWRKRVALARLMLKPSALWLLDEPAANLDEEGVALLGGLIASRTHKGGAVVMSAHHLPPGLLHPEMAVGMIELADFA